jgi:hypothetical protein
MSLDHSYVTLCSSKLLFLHVLPLSFSLSRACLSCSSIISFILTPFSLIHLILNQPVSSLSVDLGTSYQPCSPTDDDFPERTTRAAAAPAPAPPPAVKRLTNPCEPSVPGGYDNINDDLIVSVNDVLENAPLRTR